MTIKRLDHVSVVVEHLGAAVAFFSALGMTVVGEAPVVGPWVDRVNGIENVQVDIVMMQTPDGHGRLAADEVPQSETGRGRTGGRTAERAARQLPAGHPLTRLVGRELRHLQGQEVAGDALALARNIFTAAREGLTPEGCSNVP